MSADTPIPQYFEHRRGHCRECEFATRTTGPDAGGTLRTGVTLRDRCTKSTFLIVDMLANPAQACPIGRFQAAEVVPGSTPGHPVAQEGQVVGWAPGEIQRRCGGCGE